MLKRLGNIIINRIVKVKNPLDINLIFSLELMKRQKRRIASAYAILLLSINIVFIIILTRCGCKDEYHYLSDYQKQCIYKKNDTLFYCSNTNKFDTFIVNSVNNYFQVENPNAKCKIYHEYIETNFKSLSDNSKFGGIYRSTNLKNGDHVIWLFSFSGFNVNASTIDTTLTINGVTYTKVFRTINTPATIDPPTTILKTYVSEKYGILQYEFYNGELWYLKKYMH